MSTRFPIGPAAALFEEGAADLNPAPAPRLIRFADTPFIPIADNDDTIRLPSLSTETVPAPKRRICYH
ncbi:hypothetical protein [Bauldia sp.]|uniref:hypothetical protein n=1 Tax=Bauldia sp. TaxID=2575872 RepID=UPI003BA9F016